MFHVEHWARRLGLLVSGLAEIRLQCDKYRKSFPPVRPKQCTIFRAAGIPQNPYESSGM
jgi:hypothetical protein